MGKKSKQQIVYAQPPQKRQSIVPVFIIAALVLAGLAVGCSMFGAGFAGSGGELTFEPRMLSDNISAEATDNGIAVAAGRGAEVSVTADRPLEEESKPTIWPLLIGAAVILGVIWWWVNSNWPPEYPL